MLNFFLPSTKNPDLAKAGNLLVIEVVCFVVLSVASSELGVSWGENAAFIGLLLFNLLPAYHLSKTAGRFGKSRILYGLASVIPPGALFCYFSLQGHDQFTS